MCNPWPSSCDFGIIFLVVEEVRTLVQWRFCTIAPTPIPWFNSYLNGPHSRPLSRERERGEIAERPLGGNPVVFAAEGRSVARCSILALRAKKGVSLWFPLV